MIEKITISDKAFKNKSNRALWRIEVLVSVSNRKYLSLPLQELKQVTDLLRSNNDQARSRSENQRNIRKKYKDKKVK
jgi:hypothetical protein